MPSVVVPGAMHVADPELSFEGLPHYQPLGELGRALLYLFFSLAIGVLFGLLCRGFAQTSGSAAHLPVPVDRSYSRIFAAFVTQMFLVWFVICRARFLGGGDLERGFGGYPIGRVWPLVWISFGQVAVTLLLLACLLLLWPAFPKALPTSDLDDLTIAVLRSDPAFFFGLLFNMALLGPVCEELLFRGWLWTALRRSWGVWPTAVCTAVPWVLLHWSYGWSKFIVMIPMATIISLVRYKTGTVRAAIVVHIINNAAAAFIPLVVSAFP